MENLDLHKRGFSTTKNRLNKAKKIKAVLEEFRNTDVRDLFILDIGTGNGEIASFFSRDAQVVSVDIEKNVSTTLAHLLNIIPLKFYRLLVGIHPTLIVLLEKKKT